MKGTRRAFTVEGLNIERFVRRAGEQGVQLSHMRRTGRKLHAMAEEDKLSLIREAAEQGGWRYTEGGKHGLGRYIEAGRQRWMLVTAALVCMVLLVTALQLIWYVEVTGEAIYRADVEKFLVQAGIRPFVWKKSVDVAALRDALEWRYPDIAWADCGWRGTTLKIELVQGVPQGETVTHAGSGDVVASRGGIVDSIVTMAGTPLVQPGDVIQTGQVLIEGQERSGSEETVPVMARGKVMARVWDSASVRMNITEQTTAYTGAQQETWMVVCPWFSLWQAAEAPYELQDVSRSRISLGGLFWPFVLQKEIRMEAEAVKRTRTMADAEAEAGEAALRLLREKIGIYDELVDKWVDYCMIEDEVLEAVAYGQRLIDVAEPRRHSP